MILPVDTAELKARFHKLALEIMKRIRAQGK
jgi:hypothetical protein